MGWLAAALTVLALNGATDAVTGIASPAQAALRLGSGYSGIVVGLPIVALMLLAALQCPLPRGVNPVLLGLVLSLAFGSLHLINLGGDAHTLRNASRTGEVLLTVLFVLVGVVVCLVVARLETVPYWVRRAAMVATAAECAAQIFSTWNDGGQVLALLALLATIVAAVQIGSTSIALLVETIIGKTHRTDVPPARIEDVEDAVQHAVQHQDVMHELRSTVAGITNATQLLMSHGDQVPAVRKVTLEQMLDSELSRLGRLLDPGPVHPPRRIDLDTLISPMVVSQRAAGHEVLWQPCGIRAVGRPDDLTESLHILMTNAARHARGAVVTVSVTAHGDSVEIRVSDSGPGISPVIAPHLFDRGSRRERSPGEGIGLHIAQRLLREQGGSLCLENSSPQSGTTFLISVPGTPREPQEQPPER